MLLTANVEAGLPMPATYAKRKERVKALYPEDILDAALVPAGVLGRSAMTRSLCVLAAGAPVVSLAAGRVQARGAAAPGEQPATAAVSAERALLDRYCVTCHNEGLLAQGTVPVAFEDLDTADVGAHAEVWEQVVRKLRLGMMPPVGRPRPDQETADGFLVWLETELDRAAARAPNPGRPAVRRLTGPEYINAIKSLLAVEIDERWLLFPADNVDEQGFGTNGDVLSISPALFERYLAAANRISRLAVGDTTVGPGFAAATYETPRLLYQDDRVSDDLPFGSRGGMTIRHYFPVDGEYELTIRLRRMIYDYIVGMREAQQLDVRLDGTLLESFTVGDAERRGYPSAYSFFGTIRGDPAWEEYVSKGADANLDIRFPAVAGLHVVVCRSSRAIPRRPEFWSVGCPGFPSAVWASITGTPRSRGSISSAPTASPVRATHRAAGRCSRAGRRV